MKVTDLMRTNILIVSPETPLKKINETLHHFQSDYVIVAEGKKLLGIVTYSDLFRRLLPSYKEVMEDESYWLIPETMEGRVEPLKTKPVSEIMTTKLVTISKNTPAVNAGALMIAKKIKQIPVVENDELIGVISFRDITWGFLLKSKDTD